MRPIIWDQCLEAVAYIPTGITYCHLVVPYVVSSIDLLPVAVSPIKTENSIRLFYTNRNNPGTIWKRLIEKVKTKYVYIGRNVAHITKYDRLERLVREINNLDAYAVGSAIRGYHRGNVSSLS